MGYTFERSNINVPSNEENLENIVPGTRWVELCVRPLHMRVGQEIVHCSYNKGAKAQSPFRKGLKLPRAYEEQINVNFEKGREKKLTLPTHSRLLIIKPTHSLQTHSQNYRGPGPPRHLANHIRLCLRRADPKLQYTQPKSRPFVWASSS